MKRGEACIILTKKRNASSGKGNHEKKIIHSALGFFCIGDHGKYADRVCYESARGFPEEHKGERGRRDRGYLRRAGSEADAKRKQGIRDRSGL